MRFTPLADGIRRRGFRKWYERQLVESHAWLVTCVLCMVLVAALMEELRFRQPLWKPLLALAVMLGACLLAWHGWTRYRDILFGAERIAEHSTCEVCDCYGRFEVTDAGETHPGREGSCPEPWLRVRCRKCGHAWRIG